MNEEILQIVELIEFKNFKEKLEITKEYDHKAKMEIMDDRYVYVEREEDDKNEIQSKQNKYPGR